MPIRATPMVASVDHDEPVQRAMIDLIGVDVLAEDEDVSAHQFVHHASLPSRNSRGSAISPASAAAATEAGEPR